MNTDKKMKLLIFGVTRHTGWHCMQQALKAGHQVTAVIRNPGGFTFTHPNLKVVKGDALQLPSFEKEVEGKDAVISTLGNKPSDLRKPTVVCSQGVANMMTAMQKYGIDRLMCVSALGLEANPKMGGLQVFFLKILQWILKNPYADLAGMETEVKASNFNWTIIRAPRLLDGAATGEYRVAVGEDLWHPRKISRADLGEYLVSHVADAGTYRKFVQIAY